MLIVEAVLIAKDMGVLPVCNLLQSQDMSTQIAVNKSRVVSGGLPSLGLPERRLETMAQEVIPCQGHSTLTLSVHYSVPSQGQLVQLAVLTQ